MKNKYVRSVGKCPLVLLPPAMVLSMFPAPLQPSGVLCLLHILTVEPCGEK